MVYLQYQNTKSLQNLSCCCSDRKQSLPPLTSLDQTLLINQSSSFLVPESYTHLGEVLKKQRTAGQTRKDKMSAKPQIHVHRDIVWALQVSPETRKLTLAAHAITICCSLCKRSFLDIKITLGRKWMTPCEKGSTTSKTSTGAIGS